MSTYKLTVQNYQILQKAELTFNQGLTLITGPSNHGKSSLIKALQQLVYNSPGTNYITHNHTKTTIRFQKFNSPTDSTPIFDIQYSKDTKGNGQYDVQTHDSQERFTKLGSSQLDQIKHITHIDKSLNYNFWNQMDKPFMLSLTNKEQFDLLQQSPHTATLSTIQHNMTQDRKVYAKELDNHQSQLQLLQQQDQQYKQQLQGKEKIDSLFKKTQELTAQKQTLDQLQTFISQFDQIDLQSIQSKLNGLQNIPSTHTITQHKQTLDQITQLFNQLTRTVQPINEHLNTLKQTQTRQDQLKLFMQTHFTTCPLCHQPFNSINHNTH